VTFRSRFPFLKNRFSMILKLVMPYRSGTVLDCICLNQTVLYIFSHDATVFCLSVEAHGQNHVKHKIQVQISLFEELIFNDFEACYAL
jgi:hypothetical protein